LGVASYPLSEDGGPEERSLSSFNEEGVQMIGAPESNEQPCLEYLERGLEFFDTSVLGL
jgi:hypothetical protein